MLEISPLVLAMSPILIATIQGLKISGLNSKYAFPVSIVLGIAYANLVLMGQPFTDTIIQGILLGLTSSGLFSGGKRLLE